MSDKLVNRINDLLVQKQKTIKSLRNARNYLSSGKASVLSSLRNNKEFETQKDRDLHLKKVEQIWGNVRRAEIEINRILEVIDE